VRVNISRGDGVVRSVSLLADDGRPIAVVDRFLAHLFDSGCSPNTASAYAYDLKYFFQFLVERELTFEQFRPAIAIEYLSWLRHRPSRRSAQRLSLALTTAEGRLLAPATVARALAAVSSFYEWAIAAEAFPGEHPMERHRPFAGQAVVSSRSVAASGCACRCASHGRWPRATSRR
jgi:integrase/recombinase XerD